MANTSAESALTTAEETRRRNQTLRTLVDGLLEHVRDRSNLVDELTPDDLERRHERVNRVAELKRALITEEKNLSARCRKARYDGLRHSRPNRPIVTLDASPPVCHTRCVAVQKSRRRIDLDESLREDADVWMSLAAVDPTMAKGGQRKSGEPPPPAQGQDPNVA